MRKIVLFSLVIGLLFLGQARSTSPLQPGQRYGYQGFNLGAGGTFSGEYRSGAQSLTGGYWLEAGYNLTYMFSPLSVNIGMHQDFYFDSIYSSRLTIYADFSGFFVSVGPLVTLRDGHSYGGGFVAVNWPFEIKHISRWRSASSGDLAVDAYLQIRAEIVWGLPDTYTIGFMVKCRFLEWFKVAPAEFYPAN
ncbi:MAG: hypothetical protein JRJ87_09500 [Deltaproteobacteria bacterium]|nr:hypothetical protein [Deltaproteobacteria bacterium]